MKTTPWWQGTAAGRLHEVAMQAAQVAEEQQASPVRPAALSCPQKRGPSRAARAEPVRFGPYWDQTGQERSALRAHADP